MKKQKREVRILESGLKVNINWKPIKSEFYAWANGNRRLLRLTPKKMKETIDNDWKALEKALKAEKEPKPQKADK